MVTLSLGTLRHHEKLQHRDIYMVQNCFNMFLIQKCCYDISKDISDWRTSYSVIMLSSTNDFMWQVCITYEGVILYLHSLYTWGKGKTGAPSQVGRGSFWKLQNRSNMYMYG